MHRQLTLTLAIAQQDACLGEAGSERWRNERRYYLDADVILHVSILSQGLASDLVKVRLCVVLVSVLMFLGVEEFVNISAR